MDTDNQKKSRLIYRVNVFWGEMTKDTLLDIL